jgi:hypothetical protein
VGNIDPLIVAFVCETARGIQMIRRANCLEEKFIRAVNPVRLMRLKNKNISNLRVKINGPNHLSNRNY